MQDSDMRDQRMLGTVISIHPDIVYRIEWIAYFSIFWMNLRLIPESDDSLDVILGRSVRFPEFFRRYSRAYRIAKDPFESVLDFCKVFESYPEVANVGINRPEKCLVA